MFLTPANDRFVKDSFISCVIFKSVDSSEVKLYSAQLALSTCKRELIFSIIVFFLNSPSKMK